MEEAERSGGKEGSVWCMNIYPHSASWGKTA